MVPSGPPWQIVLVIVMALLAAPASSSSDLTSRGLNESKVGDCLVSRSQKVDQPSEVPLLAYVSRSINVTLGFTYFSFMPREEREAVSLNSTGATRSKNGQNWTDIALPWLLPEGWNTFLLNVTGERVTVTLVQGEEWLTLVILKIPSFITTVYAEGTVALCRSASPEWEVFPEEKREVFLQPWSGGKAQWVEVSGKGSGAAAPYIAFPSALNDTTNVTIDTLLRITTNLQGDHVLLKVFKMRSEHSQMQDGDGEVIKETTVPVTQLLIMVVGDSGSGGGSGESGGGSVRNASIHVRLRPSLNVTESGGGSVGNGSIHVRLRPSLNVTNEDIKTENTWSIGCILGFVVLPVVVVVTAVAVVRKAVVKKVVRFLKLHKSESPSDQTEKMLGSGSGVRAPIDNPDRDKTPSALSTLIQEFKDCVSYDKRSNTTVVTLHADDKTCRLLERLQNCISEVELLEAYVCDASEFCSPYPLPCLPDAQKVNLDVAGFTKGSLESVRKLVEMLQPQNWYSRIDFRGGSNSGTMEIKDWETLLNSLSKSGIKVKGKVYLPPNAVDEGHQLNLGFLYECRATDQ